MWAYFLVVDIFSDRSLNVSYMEQSYWASLVFHWALASHNIGFKLA